MTSGLAAGAPRRGLGRPLLVLGLLAAAALSFVAGRAFSRPSSLSYQQLTFQRGSLSAARFAPDGSTIVYAAAWNGSPVEVLSTRAESPESRALGLAGSNLLALSSTGELALAANCEYFQGTCRGTLARVPLSGGAPRELLDDVTEADWTPDGKQLAVVHYEKGRARLEFPPGKLLYEAPGWISHLRFAPSGEQLAFIDHPARGDDGGAIVVVDLAGQRRVLADGWGSAAGLAWAPSGRELWFTAAETGRIQPLRAVTLQGHQRVVLQAPARLVLQDIGRDGHVLLARESARGGLLFQAAGATAERDLSWFDWSTSAHLADDAQAVLFSERGEGTRGTQAVYLRNTDGSAAVKLGEGRPLALSPDREWALVASGSPQKLVLLPTGAGTPREINGASLGRVARATWFPRSQRLLLLATEADNTRRAYALDLAGGEPRALTPPGQNLDFSGSVVAPDESVFAAVGPSDQILLFPLDGSSPRPVPSAPAGSVPIQWSSDGRYLFVSQREALPARIDRIDVTGGASEPWKQILPGDVTGMVRIPSIGLARDGQSYVYTFRQRLSELYLADGLR